MKKNSELRKTDHTNIACSSSSDNHKNDTCYKIKFNDLLNQIRAVCHELSQPVTILLGYAEIMLSNMEANDPLYDKLNEINKQADKIDEIIRRMHQKIKYTAEENGSGNEVIGKI